MPAQANVPAAATASVALRSARRGPRMTRRTPRTASRGSMARSMRASESSWARLGSGAGTQRSGGRGGSIGSFSASKRTVVMSTPETPSTIAWCVLPTIAKRPPFSPSISQSSQSGFERSSCCEKIRAASTRSCCSEPGSGREVWRTW